MAGTTARGEQAGELTHDAGVVGIELHGRARRLLQLRELGILGAAVLLFVVLSILRPDTFLTEDNVLRVAQQISLLTIIATGMTYLFIAGELDLSVGALYGLLAVGVAKSFLEWGWSPALAFPVVVLAGMAVGLFNGIVTTHFKIPSFIVTLGMMSVLRGSMLLWTKNRPPSGVREEWYNKITGSYIWDKIPAQIFWMIVIVPIAAWMLAKTRFGYHVYATGSNAQAAANVGIDTNRVKIICFVILGGLAGIAAFILTGWLKGASTSTGQGYELDVIAAVVIGGTNLFGGIGSVFGTVLGAAITGMISNGLVLLGADQHVEPVVKGAVIILAVLLDVTIRRRQRI